MINTTAFKKIAFAFSFALLCFLANSQEECTFTLSKAQKLFDAGTIEQIPEMLKPCIENGFTDEERQQALKLIILAYLFDNNQKEADKVMLKFLKKYPEYEISPSDQAEFVQLFSTYRTLPFASVGIVGFTNFTFAHATKLYGTDGNNGTYKNTGFGFQAGVSYQQYIHEKFDLNLEVLYVSNSYQYQVNNAAQQSTTTFTESQSRLEIPLTIIYKPFVWGKFVPYARLGFSTGILLSATANETWSNPPTSAKYITNQSLPLTKNREPLQIFGIGGAGICYNFSHSFLMLDFRYNQGFTQEVNDKNRSSASYSSTVLSTRYNENDFKINNLWISVGFFYKFYKPEKNLIK